MSDRRDFLKMAALVSAGVALPLKWDLPAGASQLVMQTPLSGRTVPRYVEPLPTFTGRRITATSITALMQEFQQKVLPAGFYSSLGFPYNNGTYVWGYGLNGNAPSFPGISVEAKRGTPTTITYVNNLSPGTLKLQPLLTVDETVHWADPLNEMGSVSPTHIYTGPIPLVPHLHGAEVQSEFDGGPQAWFTANGLHGTAYRTFSKTSKNAAVYKYPNTQEATTLWFHDHALGMTRLNVYSGLATFYLLRDPNSLDTGVPAVGGLPAGPYEQEIVIQDRQFDTNGQLYFPDGSGSGLNGTPPNPSVHPYWIPEFFGDIVVVNGKSWPFFNVEPRRYRFRFLNGSNARFYELHLQNRDTKTPGPAFWVIGTDGGLLDFPVKLNDPLNNKAPRPLMAPAERFDVIIDFSAFAGQVLTLVNSAKAPFPNGMSPDPSTFGEVMRFNVGVGSVTDTSYDPSKGGALRQPIVRLANPATGALNVKPDVKRQLVLVEVEGPGGPIEVLVNNSHFDGLEENTGQPIPGSTAVNGNFVTEFPRQGATEEWEIINTTADAHPIHLHLIQFQLINRQAFNVTQYRAEYDSLFPDGTFIPGFGPPLAYNTPNGDGAVGGNPAVSPYLPDTNIHVPLPEETGWKDTLKMYPGTVTRIVARYAPQNLAAGTTKAGTNYFAFDPTTGPGYMVHCHILDHEDNEMMRPYQVKK